MAKRNDEEWEEDEVEEEDMIDRHEKTINDLMDRRAKCDPLSTEWVTYTDLIAAEESALREAEEGRTQRATREDMRRHRFDLVGQIIGNGLMQGVVELIKSGFNRKNVKTITKCEDNGDIVKSAAQKLINSR